MDARQCALRGKREGLCFKLAHFHSFCSLQITQLKIASNPFAKGFRDCDHESECEGALVCGTDNCPWDDWGDCCKQKTMSAQEAMGKK